MIVTNVESGWEIVYQSAHALLAGRLAAELRPIESIPYWTETLTAVVDHDDLKESFGKNTYLTELGAPKDFTQFRLTARERYDEVRRRVEHGYRKHRWIGLLAARHAEELYREGPRSKLLDDLLTVERDKRRAFLRDLKTDERALEAAYAIMQWSDRASLILCQGAVPKMHRRLEITSLGGQRYELWETEDETLAVDPWPFRNDEFTATVEVRTLHQLTFSSDRELEACLLAAPVEERRWTFRKPAATRS